MRQIALITIGQTPRDELVQEVGGWLPDRISIIQAGALDGLSSVMIAAHAPATAEKALVTQLQDGSEASVDGGFAHARLQQAIRGLENQVDLIGVVCSAPFPALACRVPLVIPYRLLQGALAAAALPGPWGVLVPAAMQIQPVRGELQQWGLNAVVLAVSPYTAGDDEDIAVAVRRLREAGASAVFLNCFGYTLAMKRAAQAAGGCPVVAIRSLFGRMLAELVD